MTVKPIENVTLGASYAYTYTNVPLTANPNPGPTFGVLTQAFVVYTPRNAPSGYFDYDLPLNSEGTKLRFHIDGDYCHAQYTFQAENVLAEPSFIVNSRLALADIKVNDGKQNVTIAAWARNLFNESHYYRRSNFNNGTLGGYGNFNPPRTYGIEATVNF